MKKSIWRTALLGVLSAAAASNPSLAQAPHSTPPAAVRLPPSVDPGILQIELKQPIAEKSAGGPPSLLAPLMPGAPEGAGALRFVLTDVVFEGGGVLSPAALKAFATSLIGREVSLAEVYGVSAAITREYASRGYPLSVAVIPAQDIIGGRVRIVVIEGYVAEVVVAGDAGRATRMLKRIGEKLKATRPLTNAALERYLLIANEIPGLEVRSVFDQAPKENGGVKLVLEASHKLIDASIGANNRGSRPVGRERATLAVAAQGALTGRESLGFNLVKTFNVRELTYASVNGGFLINAEGTALSLSATYVGADPSVPTLRALGFNSKGWSGQIAISHPLIRSRKKNLRLVSTFDIKDFRSEFGATPNTAERLSVLRFGAAFDRAGAGGASTQASLFLTKGLHAFGASRESDPGKSRVDGDGSFVALAGDISRKQPLGRGFDLVVSAGAQIASRQLLSSEECGYGGAKFGRGFDNYAISGDSCVFGVAELRYGFSPSTKLKLQPYIFYDAGSSWERGGLLPGELRQKTGQSIGGGLRIGLSPHVSGLFEVAKPLTRDIASEGDDDARVFFSVTATR